MFSAYWKAIAAAVVAAAGTIAAVWQAALSDDTISSDEWGLIVSAVITGVVSVVAVWAARNKPVTE